MGANRSGLINGMTLMRVNGMSGETAVEIIKRNRRSGGQEPLSNPMFEHHLRCLR
jgi:protein-tyrosine phosphatase